MAAPTTATGRGLTLTVGTKTYTDQTSSVVLVMNEERATVDTLSGRYYKATAVSGTLTATLYQDWSNAQSLCKALYNATNTAPDTTLSFTFVADTGTFTGNVLPNFPQAGGAATDVLSTPVEFTVVGTPTLA